MNMKINVSDIKILTLDDFTRTTKAGNRSVMPWETFDPIPSGAFGPANIGFYVNVTNKKEGYAVAIPPSVKAIHGKDIMTQARKEVIDGVTVNYIFVYSKKALAAFTQ